MLSQLQYIHFLFCSFFAQGFGASIVSFVFLHLQVLSPPELKNIMITRGERKTEENKGLVKKVIWTYGKECKKLLSKCHGIKIHTVCTLCEWRTV